MKRILTILVAGLIAMFGVLATVAPANATGKNGVVEVGELGLYYYQNFSGPAFDLYTSDSNFAGDVFPGTGISADNNTESDWNRDSYRWHVFTGASYTGSHGCIAPGASGNFNATYKNAVSSAYYATSGC